MASDALEIAVVTGEHGFEEAKFDAAFASMDGIAPTREELPAFVADPRRDAYDAVVFYNFHQGVPDSATAEALTGLTERGQGIVVLHHAILAFLDWEEWGRLVGLSNREFGYDPGQRIRVEVADPTHPIAQGVEPWEMTEETYSMEGPGSDSVAVLTVDHPKSMRVVGWAREHGNARVFCFQCGHDNRAYREPMFRRVLANAIRWVARAD